MMRSGKIICSIFALCAASVIVAQGQVLTTLATFDGTNGAVPEDSLVQGIDGKLYGTASYYGVNGSGTIFNVTTSGVLTAIYSFGGLSPNGVSGLVQATDGNFYGTIPAGGANGCGAVFKVSPAGALTTLHSFNCESEGDGPSGLVEARNGKLYGTTYQAGADLSGTVFAITPGGTLTTLYNFCSQLNCTDGAYPEGGLIQANDGQLYGTTSTYGSIGYGTVFKITPSGVLTTLHNFSGTDGGNPVGGVIQAANGDFYGTTFYGGANDDGTVFKMTPNGTLTTLHSFSGGDGSQPTDRLAQATDGNFYGTTSFGGIDNDNCYSGSCGTVFEITPKGKRITLHRFNSTDGGNPYGGLYQATDGTLYGTTEIGGADNEGTVFSLSMGLGPFVSCLPCAAKTGQPFGILGQALEGTSTVSLNGVPVSFTVKLNTLIVATVPSGATTGYVTVTTPSGTLTSNVPFNVIP